MHARRTFLFAVVGFTFLAGAAAAQEPAPDTNPFRHLKYRSIGPAAGGRICRVAGVPGDPRTCYAATASAGIWKSADGGITWKPIFDDQIDSSIGSLAVAPSNPNVLYAGAGEANIRGNVVAGHGIYKSIDAGQTWTHVWKQQGQIGTLIVHPTNPDIAFAAVLGHAFGPNPERGVYRTRDGGKSWQRVLTRDADTGASDVALDPNNPHIVFAGMWQTRRRPWELISGGPGSGLHVSRDGGDTWTQLKGKGLPEGPWGKIGVAVAPSDGRRVYALIEAENGGLFRSDDSGATWRLASGDRNLRIRAWYYSTVHVDPKNPDVVWCPNIPLLRSIDGGKTFQTVRGPHHGDHHDLWIDPLDPRRILDANDGGVDVTINGGETWYAAPLPISQFYHINVDNRTPYHVSGTMQDLGSTAGPSNSLNLGGISRNEWHRVGGGETGYTVHDPDDPNIVYAGEYGGYISRYDHRSRLARNISIYPNNGLGHAAEALRYRFRWPAPIAMSPHDSKVLYHAGNVLFRTTNAGMNWTAVSPDLTRNDRSKQKWSGGPITGDNTSAEYYCTISAVAESPVQKDLLWVGTDDGLVYVSRDGGKTWANVTANLPSYPEWATVKMIEPSRFDAGSAYVVVDAHLLDDMRPYLFRTTDFGKTWKGLSGHTSGLAQDVYLHVVREDPKRRGLLFAGTERGVAFSSDDGGTWRPLRLNLPTVPVHDLVVKNDDLVVGTHGRSIWILDDLTPLRAWMPELARKPVHLFTPSTAVRWNWSFSSGGPGAGQNPPRGAAIVYHLAHKPKGDVTLEILDAQDRRVHLLSSRAASTDGEEPSFFRAPPMRLSSEPGVQRFVWDLSYAGPTRIQGARLRGDPGSGPTVNPGTYTLRLTTDGMSATAPLVVQADPRLRVSDAERDEQLKLALTIRDDISRLAEVVHKAQEIRQQLLQRNSLLKGEPKAASLVQQSRELAEKLDALEAELHNSKAQIANDVIAQRGGTKLYARYTSLFSTVKLGDGAPTQGMREVHAELAGLLKQHEETWSKCLADLEQLNKLARSVDVPTILVPQTSRKTR